MNSLNLKKEEFLEAGLFCFETHAKQLFMRSAQKGLPTVFEYLLWEFQVLKKIQEKGVQVITVAGDLGQKTKELELKTKEGIYILGSGINNSAISHNLPKYVTNTSPDKLLIFNHDLNKKELSWEFIELTQVIEDQKKSSEE